MVFKVVSDRNCPFYSVNDLFVLTSQAVQIPIGHPSCLILVREMTNMLFSTIIPAAATGFDELESEIYTCGGCTGLVKFQIEDEQVPQEGRSGESVLDMLAETEGETEKREQEGKAGSKEIVISGQLSEISPSEILQFFHMHQKTGRLTLDVPSGIGRVAFREGAIIGAKFLEYDHKEAIFALLREDKGSFSFISGIPVTLREVEDIGDFMMLLMEGIKRMDEAEG